MLIPFGVFSAAGAGGGGASGTYDLISTTILGSNTPSVTFTSSGAWTPYKHLQIRFAARSTVASYADNIAMQLNGDTAANYTSHILYGDGNSATSAAFTSASYMYLASANAGATADANGFGVGVIDFLDFASTSKNKTMRALAGYYGRVESANKRIALCSGAWLSTSAMTSITLSNSANFLTGSRFSIYGIKGA